MQGVLIVERIVLECLEKCPRKLFAIQKDTGLNHNLLVNILSILLMRGMIHYKNSEYSLNLSKKNYWLAQANERASIKAELKELFSGLVNEYYKKEWNKEVMLNVQKVWLTQDEREKLQEKLRDVNNFIRKAKHERKFRPRNETTKEKQILIWGMSPYHTLIDNMLSNL